MSGCDWQGEENLSHSHWSSIISHWPQRNLAWVAPVDMAFMLSLGGEVGNVPLVTVHARERAQTSRNCLSPLQGLFPSNFFAHDSRRGLRSVAAPRLVEVHVP